MSIQRVRPCTGDDYIDNGAQILALQSSKAILGGGRQWLDFEKSLLCPSGLVTDLPL